MGPEGDTKIKNVLGRKDMIRRGLHLIIQCKERKGGKQGKEYPADQCIVMRCSSLGIDSEKCIISRFCHCANVIECTYTNLETWH